MNTTLEKVHHEPVDCPVTGETLTLLNFLFQYLSRIQPPRLQPPLPRPITKILEIGAGTGAITIPLATKFQFDFTALDIQPELISYLAIGADQLLPVNSGRITSVCCDLAKFIPRVKPETYDLIYTNPPFFSGSSGKYASRTREISRQKKFLPFKLLGESALKLLKPAGVMITVTRGSKIAAELVTEVLSVSKDRLLLESEISDGSLKQPVISCFRLI